MTNVISIDRSIIVTKKKSGGKVRLILEKLGRSGSLILIATMFVIGSLIALFAASLLKMSRPIIPMMSWPS